MRSPGRLIASGRDSDIYECGSGLVLRRSRAGRSMESEARTMDFVRAHGFPAPAVDEVSGDGTELVMERIDGPTMMVALGRRPWQVRSRARQLAELHEQLHAIAAPEWLPAAPGSDGAAMLHLDLHPLNVILGARGPVVIDWPRAARGDQAADVALTWVLLACATLPSSRIEAAVLGRFRSAFVRAFLASFDQPSVRGQLDAVVEYKATDDHMDPAERAAMRRLAADQTDKGSPPGGGPQL